MSKCEICGKDTFNIDLINVGIDIGFHIGDYGNGQYEKYKVEPRCVRVFSIYMCSGCKSKIEEKGYFKIDVISELRDLLKEVLMKNMIIEGLK